MLKDMDIKNIISIANREPNFLTIFRVMEDHIDNLRHATKFRIEDLIIRVSKYVSDRKAATQIGFRELGYPQSNGDVLKNLELKKTMDKQC